MGGCLQQRQRALGPEAGWGVREPLGGGGRGGSEELLGSAGRQWPAGMPRPGAGGP